MKQPHLPLTAVTIRILANPLPIALLLSLTLATSPAQASSWLDKGIKEYSAGQYSQAIDSLRNAIAREKGSDVAHYYLANALMSGGRRGEAAVEYRRAFMLASSEDMANKCRRALKGLNVPLPDLSDEDMKTRSARANMTPYSVASVEALADLAGKRVNSPKILESHKDGVEQFKTAPEASPDMRIKWDKWIEDFRLEFNTSLFRLMGPAYSANSGKVKMIFSVDSKGKLRGRILESTAPFFYEYYLLATTRKLNHSPVLAFPSGSSIPGYNFTMGWMNGAAKTKFNRNTMIELRRLAYQLRRDPITGEQAVAMRLGQNNANGTLSSQNTSAELAANRASGMLTSQRAGSLPIPNFDAVVAGMVLPRKPEPELKATTLTLDEGSKSKNGGNPAQTKKLNETAKIEPPTESQLNDTKLHSKD